MLAATELHCSVGIGDNKVRAKIATEFGKPRGIFRLTAENWFEVMGDKPTRDLWGVGSKVQKRLAAHGITTVRELADADEEMLVAEFGPRMGVWYHGLGSGLGPSVVDDTPWVARSHSRETTYQQNLTTTAQVTAAVRELAVQAFDDCAAEGRDPSSARISKCGTRRSRRRRSGASSLHRRPIRRNSWRPPSRSPGPSTLSGRCVSWASRAEMTMPDEGDTAERTPVRGRI